MRDLLYVDDLVELYLQVVARADDVAGKAYNVGGGPGNTLSLLELLERLDGLSTTNAEPRLGDQKVFVADVRGLEAALGWWPATTVDHGLERLLAWIADNAETAATIVQPA
jgi:CDP-paratose 2-epimerase